MLISVLIRPTAIPATGAFPGAPVSINTMEAPQTVAIEKEPSDSKLRYNPYCIRKFRFSR